VPEQVNQVEFRLFLRDKLRKFDILAYDVFKKQGVRFATVTVANPANGQKFLDRYGPRARPPLSFGFIALNCKRSNKPGQPAPLKVVSLLQKEEEYRSRRLNQPSTAGASGSSQPIFPFTTLMTGIWDYDHRGTLLFDQKFKDMRTGSITFGRHALVIYLKIATSPGFDWHGRIDIPYAILEHTIPFLENGQRGSITLTLKSPPKMYRIVATDDIHLYTGDQSTASVAALPNLESLSLGGPVRGRKVAKLERLCGLHANHDRTSALSMVYKLLFPNVAMLYQAWAFMKDFSVPQAHCFKPMALQNIKPLPSMEHEYLELDRALSRSTLHFAEKFQVLALVLEGTLSPMLMLAMLPSICSICVPHSPKMTAVAIRNLARQIPTPGPDVDLYHFTILKLRKTLADNIRDAESAEVTYTTMHGKRKQQEHLALTYKATVTPTGT
jgi:hypothetical protein